MKTISIVLLTLLLGSPAIADSGDSAADTGDTSEPVDSADSDDTCTTCGGAGDIAGEGAGCGWEGRASLLLLGAGLAGRRYSLRSFQSRTRQ